MARRVTTGLAKVGMALKQHAWADVGDRSLTPTQGQALAVLRASLRVGTLGDQLGVTSPSASDSVAALVPKDLFTKAPLAGDGRAVVVRLTQPGLVRRTRPPPGPTSGATRLGQIL